MLRRRPEVGYCYALAMHRSAAFTVVPAVALWLALAGCQPEHTEQAKQAYDQGVEQAKQGYDKGVDSAKQGYAQGVESAKQGVDSAKQGLADARVRYEVDDKVAAARERLHTGMGEAADSFVELAAASEKGARDLSAAIDEQGKARIEGAAEAIKCKPDPDDAQGTRCQIATDLLTKLQNDPKQIAKQLMLLPKQGSTGQGLELVRLGRESVPELLGLNRKDILLELNGFSLGSLDAIRDLDQAMAGKPEAEIVYERDGERRTLVLERERSVAP
jgi:hypothetical protein